MKLNSQQRRQVRACILSELKSAKYGLTEALLLPLIQSSGFSRLTMDQLQVELEWLEARGTIRPSADKLSEAETIWCITPEGKNE